MIVSDYVDGVEAVRRRFYPSGRIRAERLNGIVRTWSESGELRKTRRQDPKVSPEAHALHRERASAKYALHLAELSDFYTRRP